MAVPTPANEKLIELRRWFHKNPEPSWCEYQTTAKIYDIIEDIGVDRVYLGSEALDLDERMEVPNSETLEKWEKRARESGVSEDLLDTMHGAKTGVIAEVSNGSGPVIGLRVDIDALPIQESTTKQHHPVEENFDSTHDGYMHACGHDAHITIGLGVLEAMKKGDFHGTLRLFFQPAEEVGGGGKPMSKSGHLDDVDYFFAVHIGFGLSTGEVSAGMKNAFALSQFQASIHGQSAHAGKRPEDGYNAIQALGASIQNLYAIPRHSDGITRVNVGNVVSESATSIISDLATFEVETRGETNELMRFMRDRSKNIIKSGAEMHECSVEFEELHETITAECDSAMVDSIYNELEDHDYVATPVEYADFGVSEDACYLMDAVQQGGGKATYMLVGSDLKAGHHTPNFDIDERSLEHGVTILTDCINYFFENHS